MTVSYESQSEPALSSDEVGRLCRYLLPADMLNELIEPGGYPVRISVISDQVLEVDGKTMLLIPDEYRLILNALSMAGTERSITSRRLMEIAPDRIARHVVSFAAATARAMERLVGRPAVVCTQVATRPRDYRIRMLGVIFDDTRPPELQPLFPDHMRERFCRALGLPAIKKVVEMPQRAVGREAAPTLNNRQDRQTFAPRTDPVDLRSDSVEQFAGRARVYRVLRPEEEVELGARVQAGLHAQELLESGEEFDAGARRDLERTVREGRIARDRFVQANLMLVVKLSNQLVGLGLDKADLIQEGNLALINAVKVFDPTLGYKFSTRASRGIVNSMKRAISNQSRVIRLPVHVIEGEIIPLKRQVAALTQRLGRQPSIDEIAADAGSEPAKIAEILRLMHAPASLDAPLAHGSDDGASVLSVVADDPKRAYGRSEDTERQMVVEELLGGLTVLERQVVVLEFGLLGESEHRFTDICKILGLRHSELRAQRGNALKKLAASQRLGELTALL